MKRVALYVRVSTEEQKKHGLSVDNQIEALEQYAKENDYIVFKTYNDAGISARKKYTKRPALLELIDDVKMGNIDLVLFTRLDRWFRSVADYYEVQTILDEYKVAWRAIWEDYETETSSGVFKVNIMLSVAQSEADRTSERIRSIVDYKRAKGDYVGSAPTGYKIQNCQLVKDDNAELIQATFDYFATNYKTKDTLRFAHSLGLDFSLKTLHEMLRREVYYGKASGGYSCEPYITREQYEKNRKVIESRTREPKDIGRIYIFAGLIQCPECGGKMSGSVRISQKGTRSNFYRCGRHFNSIGDKCSYGKTITESKLEKYLLEIFDDALAEYSADVNYEDKVKKSEKQIANLENRLKRIGDRYEDGDISRDEYKAKRQDVLNQIAELKSVKPSALPVLPPDWKTIYSQLDKSHRKAFWCSSLHHIVVDGYDNIRIFY